MQFLTQIGGRVVDYTGGNTGSSLAMVCAARGYPAHFVSSDAFSEEKLQTMRAFGARLDVVPSDGGKVTPDLIQRCLARVRELASEDNTFWTDQFNNPDNRAGYHAMAEETLAALGGRLDEYVMMVGTAGSFSGNAEIFKARLPGIRCIAGEPMNSQVLSGRAPTGGHRIEGTGAGFVPAIYRGDLADAVMAVSDDDACATARRLAREEGIFGGIPPAPTSGWRSSVRSTWRLAPASSRPSVLGPQVSEGRYLQVTIGVTRFQVVSMICASSKSDKQT